NAMKKRVLPRKPGPWYSAGALRAASLALLTGCTALFGAKKSSPPSAPAEAAAPEESSTDEEAGVRHLQTLMRQFNDAVGEKRFEAADGLLKRAEAGVARANDITRSHPDFDDTAELVARGRPRYDAAVERDRIERRNAAIDALIAKGQEAMRLGTTLLTELGSRTPSEGDMEHLDEALRAFGDLKRDGEGFMDEGRYRTHAQARDALAGRLGQAQVQANRQLAVMRDLGPIVNAGIAAAARAREEGTPEDQLGAYREVAERFEACAAQLTKIEAQAPGTGALMLETRLGRMTLTRTREQCASLRQQAGDKIGRFAWDNLVGSLQRALPPARGTGRAAIEAFKTAAPMLEACAAGSPGAVPRGPQAPVFETPFGKLQAAELRTACGKELGALKGRQAVLAWQAGVEEARDRVDAAVKGLSQAGEAAPAQAQMDLLGKALGGLAECVDSLEALGRAKEADRKFKVTSALGTLTAADLAKACKRAQAQTQGRLPAAAAAVKREQFLTTCHADEVTVVEREGLPVKVEALPRGRVFVYAGKRVAFDAGGHRTDEALLKGPGG
ncbi:MAG TPA: hypothetical protein VFH51_12985, partial [Myxococcota bacterium]|nr:hypothetical protein [Myxococcota bacterium]